MDEKKQRVAIDFGKLHQSRGKWNDCVCILAWTCMNGVKKFPLCNHVCNWIQNYIFFQLSGLVLFVLSNQMYNSPIRRVFFLHTASFNCVHVFHVCNSLFFFYKFLFYVSSPCFFSNDLIYMWSINDCMVFLCARKNFQHINFSFMLNIRIDEKNCMFTDNCTFSPVDHIENWLRKSVFFFSWHLFSNTIHFLFS